MTRRGAPFKSAATGREKWAWAALAVGLKNRQRARLASRHEMTNPEPHRHRKSLGRKVLVPVIWALAAMLLFIAWMTVQLVRDQVHYRLEERADAMASAVAGVAASVDRVAELQSAVSAMGDDSGVESIVVVVGADAKIIAAFPPDLVGKTLGDLPDKTLAEDHRAVLGSGQHYCAPVPGERQFGHASPLRIAAPHGGGGAGDAVVIIRLGTAQILSGVFWSVLFLGIYTATGLLLLALLSYGLFARYVLHPLGRVERQLAEGGASGKKIDAGRSSDDQIGSLVEALEESFAARREQEVELHESEKRFRLMADSAPALVWVSDGEKKLVWCNKIWLEFTGRPMAQDAGEGWLEGVHPDDVRRCREVWESAADKHEPFSMGFRLRRRDGEHRWMVANGVPRFDEEGRFVGHTGSCIDITDLKRADEKLRLSEERHRALAESARDNIWTMDLDWKFTYTSPSIETLLGYTPAEFVEKSLEDLIVPDSMPLAAAFLENVARSAREGVHADDFRGEVELRRKDGSTVWTEIIARPLSDSSGKIVEVLGVTRDITESRAAKKAMKDARDAAEAANRAKSEFLANMSHEIRTPMNAVIGLSNLLRESTSLDTQRKYAAQIHEAGSALLGVLDDVLDYSKIEAGQMQVETVPMRLSEILHSCKTLFALQAQMKKVGLTFDVAPSIPPLLMGDPLRLLQVIKNLVSNSLKFTRQGSIAVIIEPTGESANEIVIKVSVRDTGIGLSPEQQRKIFTPFAQGDVSTTRKYGGTVLGLSICRHLVDLMGGTIGVESVQGEGSTFWFTARLGKAAQSAQAADTRGPKSFADLAPIVAPIQGARILVVDDNATNCLVAQQYLRKLGLRAESVHSGAEAVQKAKDGGFDAILLDIQMPGMDGFTAAALIREHEQSTGVTTALPIIALSAAAMAKDVEASLASGMNDHISKPIDPVILARALARWVPPVEAGDAAS